MDGSGQDQVASKRPKRSVQSKLSFSVNVQACGARTAATPPPDAVAEDGGRNSEGREKEGKRKRNGKLKSQDGDPEESADNDKEAQELSGYRRKSSRVLKNKQSGKQSGGETPRKNRTPTKFGHTEKSSKRMILNGRDSTAESQPFCDLWSEAKKAAEENLRLSAGKQTHPFFSICTATKRLSEMKKVEKSENRSWFGLEGDDCISFPPFHVFDTVQDDISIPNWENWKFLETSQPKLDGYCSIKNSSIFEVSTKSLILEAACGKDTKFNNLLVDEKMNGAFNTTSSSKFSSELLSKEQLSSPSEMVHVGCNFSWSSGHCNIADDQDQCKIHNGRLASYSKRGICCTDHSLWTDKYRPEISLEVCGNAESVKLLTEWLKSWEERVVQSTMNGNRRTECTIGDSDYSSYDHESDLDELDCGDSLKNVLLITGPVGSGKSAAIYACAKEQGFKVIEVNASSLRNGAYVRQAFGEGVDSLGLTHWLAENQTNQQSKDFQELQSYMPVIAENALEADSIKVDSRLISTENAAENSSHFHIANKTLFLFEEVDVVFDEDHGFISTIFKLAETTKRPIILTSNTKRPVLPHLLDRLVLLNFKAPSYSELLYHASMICAFEKVHVSYGLLEHIIMACVGDIRRILMLLQFWCQGFRDITEKSIQCTTCPTPFDIDAVHLAIPRVVSCDLRCELSERVEEEISKAGSALEESSIVNELLQHKVYSWEFVDPLEKLNATTTVKSRKKGKLRKQSIIGHTELSDYVNHLEDLYDSDSPSTGFRRKAKQKPGVVLSSESDDGLCSDEVKPVDISANQKLSSDELKPEDASTQANSYKFLAVTTSPAKIQEIYEASQLYQIDESRDALVFQNSFEISEAASTSHVCDTSRIKDVDTCMSESSFISGTETNMNFALGSQEVSNNSCFTSLYDLNISPLIHPGVDLNNTNRGGTELFKCLENQIGTSDVHFELLKTNLEIGCLQNEEGRPSQRQLVKDCAHPDFIEQSMPRDSTACSHEVASISKTWRRLRSCHPENLKLLSSKSEDVSLVANLTSGLADLLSEADIMFSSCNTIISDNFEPTSTPCVEPDSVSWYDEHVEMGSTFAQHGLCFFTMKFDTVGSCLGLGCDNTSDLSQEMLASSTGSNALGKLLRREIISGQNSCFKHSGVETPPSFNSIRRESAADLYSAILPIVPARLSMVLKGLAFHEYLSYVGQISRFECSRLAESSLLVAKQNRRSRTRMHYLSSDAHQLSSEQAELLAQRTCFTRSSCIKVIHN